MTNNFMYLKGTLLKTNDLDKELFNLWRKSKENELKVNNIQDFDDDNYPYPYKAYKYKQYTLLNEFKLYLICKALLNKQDNFEIKVKDELSLIIIDSVKYALEYKYDIDISINIENLSVIVDRASNISLELDEDEINYITKAFKSYLN